MTDVHALEDGLRAIITELGGRGRAFALVGGLAVSIRAEVRFTRDVDFAVLVCDAPDAEKLVRELSAAGYRLIAVVEHELARRLSTVRLASPQGVVVDLLFASCGLVREIVARAEPADRISTPSSMSYSARSKAHEHRLSAGAVELSPAHPARRPCGGCMHRPLPPGTLRARSADSCRARSRGRSRPCR
ncbi:MAG: hypothetical protein OZ921_18440 [Sorangiineae bacterium]|nr:hypothetical protein [Polyangiaceae bacterium]MEB2324500.1 hypothetical protein [Sorangiineae bacterium]